MKGFHICNFLVSSSAYETAFDTIEEATRAFLRRRLEEPNVELWVGTFACRSNSENIINLKKDEAQLVLPLHRRLKNVSS